MAIYLVQDDERNSHQIGDATFIYKRMPSHIQKGFEAKHRKKGEVDMRAVLELCLEYCLIDWSGVKPHKDAEDIPFSKDLIQYLPEAIKTELISLLYEGSPDKMLKGN